MSTTLYKITGPDGEAIHGGTYRYALPTRDEHGAWTPGAWTPEEPSRICHSGWHVTTDPTQWLHVGCRAWEAETRGDSDGPEADSDKSAHASIRLLREAPEAIPDWWHEVESFVASIAAVPFFRPQRAPDPAWRVFETMDAASAATSAATRDAARAATWDATSAATRDAARAAAGGAAGAAAWDAAGSAAWDAACDAARGAARDAALVAWVLACGGLPLAPAHVAHARARWAVWEAGYGLLGDVDGTLYVYRRIADVW